MDQSSTEEDPMSQSKDDTPDDNPPSYTDSTIAQCAKIQTDWIKACPKGWRHVRILIFKLPMVHIHWAPPHPPRTLKDRLLGKHHGPVKDQWCADMTLLTYNLPRLMRKGLYWNREDVVEYDEIIEPNSSRMAWLSGHWGGWKHTRSFRIRPRGERFEWRAVVYVFTRDLSTLVEFGMDYLTPDRLTDMYAFGWHGNAVYSFDSKRPQFNFNKIHGPMPLKGQWPWPKAQNEDIKSEKEQESENTEGTVEAGIMFRSTDWVPGMKLNKAQRTSNLEHRVEWLLAT